MKRLLRKAAQRKDARRRGEKRFVPSKGMLLQMREQMEGFRTPTKPFVKPTITFASTELTP